MTGRSWIVIGAILAALGVAAGAIGAHVLKEVLKTENQLQTYEVAVRYQLYHALGLIVVGLLSARAGSAWLTAAGVLFVLGIVLFSGGIYAWLATDATPFVQVVPVGGTSWIIGWLLVAIAAWRMPRDK